MHGRFRRSTLLPVRLGPLLASGSFILSGCSSPVDVHVDVVRLRDLSATVSADCLIRTHRTVRVTAGASGRVSRLAVSEGTRVTAGDLLVELAPGRLDADVQAVAAAVGAERSNGRGWLAEARGWRPTAHDPVRSGSRRCGRAVSLRTKSTLTPSRRWPPSKPGFAGAKRSWPKRQRVSCSRCVRERGGRFGSGGRATRGHCSARTTGAVVSGPGGVDRIPAARRGLLRGTGRAGRRVGGRSTRFFLLDGNYHGFSPQGRRGSEAGVAVT